MVFLSSLLAITGTVMFTGAAAYGKGGLLQAMLNIQSPFQMFMEILFFSIYPALMGVIGMFGCLLGALIIILGK